MTKLPNCPKCQSEYTYEDGNMYICPECAHEWDPAADSAASEEGLTVQGYATDSCLEMMSLRDV